MLEGFTWFRQAAYRWTDGERNVYIDPWGVDEDAPPADLILITHAHADHYQPDEIARLRVDGTRLIAPHDIDHPTGSRRLLTDATRPVAAIIHAHGIGAGARP